MEQITLIVMNPQVMKAGSSSMRFNVTGGTLGANSGCEWVLNTTEGEVAAKHAKITFSNDRFELTQLEGDVYINGATIALGLYKRVHLTEGTELKIGPYLILATYKEDITDVGKKAKLNDILSDNSTELDEFISLLEEKVSENIVYANDEDNSRAIDPAEFFDQATNFDNNLLKNNDMFEVFLDQKPFEIEIDKSLVIQKVSSIEQIVNTQADGEDTVDASMVVKNYLSMNVKTQEKSVDNIDNYSNHPPLSERCNRMNEKELELLEKELKQTLIKSGGSQEQTQHLALNQEGQTTHLAAQPLLKGLSIHLGNEDNLTQMHNLTEEMGEALKASIQGLLAIHQKVSATRFGLLARNLQPIEDNPLRLGLSYEETVKSLFENESSVHLSAPAAITESLQMLQNHNDAMQFAISEALKEILLALSPQQLVKRFHRYRRAVDEKNDHDAGWEWKMYEKYYEELTSNRQSGFDKLFWEIFEQSYDKKIRELQY